MAHYARVLEGTVVKVHVLANPVITDDEGVEHEEWGQVFLAGLHGYQPEELIQCSYNGNFRGVYPGPGFTYNSDLDAFLPPKPDPTDEVAEWVLDEETFSWVPVEA